MRRRLIRGPAAFALQQCRATVPGTLPGPRCAQSPPGRPTSLCHRGDKSRRPMSRHRCTDSTGAEAAGRNRRRQHQRGAGVAVPGWEELHRRRRQVTPQQREGRCHHGAASPAPEQLHRRPVTSPTRREEHRHRNYHGAVASSPIRPSSASARWSQCRVRVGVQRRRRKRMVCLSIRNRSRSHASISTVTLRTSRRPGRRTGRC